MHVLVPGTWSVQQSHDLIEEVEAAVITALPHALVDTHVEPREDPRSYQDFAAGSSVGEFAGFSDLSAPPPTRQQKN